MAYPVVNIDIGGGTTDIAIVRNGGVEGTKMFALGGRSFTRRLSKLMDVTFEEAEDLKLLVSSVNIPYAHGSSESFGMNFYIGPNAKYKGKHQQLPYNR